MITLIEPSQIPPVVPLVPLAGTVLFPAGLLPVALGTPQTIAAAEAARSHGGLVVVVARAAPVEPLDAELLAIGTLAQVLRPRMEQDRLLCDLKGLARVRVASFVHRTPYLAVNITPLEGEAVVTPLGFQEFRARAIEFLLQDVESVPFSWVVTFARITDPGHLVDMLAANAPTTPALKQRVLEATSLQERLAVASDILASVASRRSARPRLRTRLQIALRRLRWRIAVSRDPATLDLGA